MLAELLNTLKRHFTDQAVLVPTRMQWKIGPRRFLYWDPEQRAVIEQAVERPGYRHELRSLMSLIDYAKETQKGSGRRILWVGETTITCEMSEGDELDIVHLNLAYSPLWLLILQLHKSPSVSQPEAIRLMRQYFANASGALNALTAIRSLRLQRTEDFESDQKHDASRIGKSIVQQATGAGELPEYIELPVNVFRDVESDFVVRIWLSIDFDNRKILFDPDDSMIEEARISARSALIVELVERTEERVAIYEGEYRVASQPIES